MAKLDFSQAGYHTPMYKQKEVWFVILGTAYQE